MRLAKWFRWVFPAKNKTNESINIVNSIAKAKKLHKELILYAHPDRHPNNQELATRLSERINENRFNYSELLKLQDIINKNLLNSLLDGSFEKMKIISTMNQAFKEYYYSGELNRLCKVSITMGNDSYRHEMSAIFFRSGFKISIENDSDLQNSEIRDISQYILSNKAFVRQLMSLGFNTLIIMGKTTKKAMQYSLKEYAQLRGFSLE